MGVLHFLALNTFEASHSPSTRREAIATLNVLYNEQVRPNLVEAVRDIGRESRAGRTS
jgi:hypothetical protein